MMSLIATIKAWLCRTNHTSNDTSLITNQPCRYRLDNDTSATLMLSDGRKLGYAQYGSPTGKAILYQHGFPGSRIEAAQFHDLSTELGLRIIAIDRPGHGWSSPHPGSKLLDWPTDVECLTEHLGLESYSIMGISGGGPSALACAYALPPKRLKCVSIVCGVGPPDIGMQGADLPHRIGWPYGIRYAPYWLGRMFWRSMAIGRLDLTEDQRLQMLLKETEKMLDRDRDIFDDVDLMRLTIRSNQQAFSQGYDGVWDDGKKSCKDFGFMVGDIRQDLKVHLWYGKDDCFVPLVHGIQIAARLGGRAQFRVEEESHAGIAVHYRREILEAIRACM